MPFGPWAAPLGAKAGGAALWGEGTGDGENIRFRTGGREGGAWTGSGHEAAVLGEHHWQ